MAGWISFKRCASSNALGPYGLGVGELAQAEMRQLAAISALLDAAHGNARVRCRKTVDEDAAGFQATRNALGADNVAGPDAAAQSVFTGVGQFNGVLRIFRDRDGGHRAEGFFVER